jgi:hypothetical protein
MSIQVNITSLNDRQSVATVALAPLSHVNEGPAILAMEDRTALGLAVVTDPAFATFTVDALYPEDSYTN